MKSLAVSLLLALGGCGAATPSVPPPLTRGHAEATTSNTLRIVERDGYHIVDLSGAVVSWGGGAQGPRQHSRFVLAPRNQKAPALIGDLTGATLIRTPVMRIASNAGPHEAMLAALGVDDKLVAIGGTFSWNDAIRRRVNDGQLTQIGYGWHSPPELEVVLASKPDVLLMALGDLDHIASLDRLRALGVTVVPTFLDSETHYLGRVEYVRLIGLLTGREREADAYVQMVSRNVSRLKELAAKRPKRTMVWAWFGGGDRWGATVRNAEAELMRDAGGHNLLERTDDSTIDAMMWVGTEQMLTQAHNADCWIIRDDHSQTFHDEGTLSRFRAWKNRCLYAITGMMKPHVNAYDYYERGVIRPDLLLADLIAMLHPELGVRAGTYIRPDGRAILG